MAPAKITVLLFFALYLGNAKAQFRTEVLSYHNKINQAKIASVKKDYATAITCYLAASKYMAPFSADMLNVSYWYELKGDSANAVNLYFQAAQHGADVLNEGNYPSYFSNASLPASKWFRDKAASLHQKFNAASEIDFRLLVAASFAKDQYARTNDLVEAKDSSVLLVANMLLHCTDSINANDLITYFQRNGMPDARKIGEVALTEFRLLVHHIVAGNLLAEKDKIKTLISDAIHQGKLPNDFLYTALDYEHRICCKKQLFGTYTGKSKEGKITYTDIEDIRNVDTRRNNWLLLPLYWSLRYNFDDNYQLPEGYQFNEQE